jgi:CBS domain containing-hemolysin-like protein
MKTLGLEIAVIIALAVINGIFAMSEVALLSARRVRLQHLAEHGNARARRALHLIEKPNNFLSTVQVGVTLVGVLAGAFGGATIADTIAQHPSRYVWLAPTVRPLESRLLCCSLLIYLLSSVNLSRSVWLCTVPSELRPRWPVPRHCCQGLGRPWSLF